MKIKDRIEGLSNENVHFSYVKIPAKSLSFARNYAIKRSLNDYLLFIDCDAKADEHWAHQLWESLLGDNVAIVGGKILPIWHKTPLALTAAKSVREQYSLFDIGDSLKEFPKVVGANFGLNIRILGNQAYFDENLGRRKGILLGGEETDLCDRALALGLDICYNGKAVVHHQILPERISYRWIFKRIYFAGVGRALKKGLPKPTHKMEIWDYVIIPIILPFYAAGYLQGKFWSKYGNNQ
jgi:glycosyltransferase involved in cell wall biosynthesis